MHVIQDPASRILDQRQQDVRQARRITA